MLLSSCRCSVLPVSIVALALGAGCSWIPDVEWDLDHCTVSVPDGSRCEASMRGGQGHDAFRLALDPGTLGPALELVFTGSGGELEDGAYQVSTESYDETVETEPGLLFDSLGGSGEVSIVDFEYVGMPSEDAGPFGFGRINAERGTFSVELDLSEYTPGSRGGEVGDTLVAAGELLPSGGGGGGGDDGVKFTCDATSAAGVCVEYTISDGSEESLMSQCTGDVTLTRDAHVCSHSGVGCRHTAAGRTSDTWTYGASDPAAIEAACTNPQSGSEGAGCVIGSSC